MFDKLRTSDAPRRTMALLLAMTIGCGLAPFVPVTASLFLARAQPNSRVGGFVLASNALGGACLPWIVGILSQHFGSLKFALELPALVGALLFLLCLIPLSKRVGNRLLSPSRKITAR